MLASRFLHLSLLTLCLSAFAAAGFAQDKPAAQEYQPEVGQAGKDVVWVPTLAGARGQDARHGQGHAEGYP